MTHKSSLGGYMVCLMAVTERGSRNKRLSEQKKQLGYEMEVNSPDTVWNSAHHGQLSEKWWAAEEMESQDHHYLSGRHIFIAEAVTSFCPDAISRILLQYSKSCGLQPHWLCIGHGQGQSLKLHPLYTSVSGVFTSQLCPTTWNTHAHLSIRLL